MVWDVPRRFPLSALLFLLGVFLCLSVLPIAAQNSPPISPTWQVPRLSAPPTIDGNLEEWESLPAMRLGTDPVQAKYFPLWGGPLDLSAKAWLAWDENNLYFAAEVTDNVLQQDHVPDRMWQNDSVQIALDPLLDKVEGSPDDREFGWALLGEAMVPFCWRGTVQDLRLDFIAQVAKKPDGRGWIYEAEVPWSEMNLKPQAGQQMGFSWMVNDSDGGRRDGWLEWAGGVGVDKDPAKFGVITLLGTSSQVATAAQTQAEYANLLNYFRAAPELSPSVSRLWQAHVSALSGDFYSAQTDYSQVMSLYHDQDEAGLAFAGLVRIYERGLLPAEIRQLCLETIQEYPSSPPRLKAALAEMFFSYKAEGNWEGAEDCFRDLLQTFPAETAEGQTVLYYIIAAAEAAGDPVHARQWASQFLALYPGDSEAAFSAVKQAQADYDLPFAAITCLQLLMEENAGNALENLAQHEIGKVCFAYGDSPQAVEAFDAVSARAAGTPLGDDASFKAASLHYELGYSAFMAKDWRDAVAHLEACLKNEGMKPMWVFAFQMLGQSYAALGKFDKAIVPYRRLVEMFPDLPQAPAAQFQIGELLFRQGLRCNARQEYHAVLERWPNSGLAALANNSIGVLERGEMVTFPPLGETPAVTLPSEGGPCCQGN